MLRKKLLFEPKTSQEIFLLMVIKKLVRVLVVVVVAAAVIAVVASVIVVAVIPRLGKWVYGLLDFFSLWFGRAEKTLCVTNFRQKRVSFRVTNL